MSSITIACRKRRIKCGEERPTCNNCIKSKRACEGYNQRVVFKYQDPSDSDGYAGPSEGGLHDPTIASGFDASSMYSYHIHQQPRGSLNLQPIAPAPYPRRDENYPQQESTPHLRQYYTEQRQFILPSSTVVSEVFEQIQPHLHQNSGFEAPMTPPFTTDNLTRPPNLDYNESLNSCIPSVSVQVYNDIQQQYLQQQNAQFQYHQASLQQQFPQYRPIQPAIPSVSQPMHTTNPLANQPITPNQSPHDDYEPCSESKEFFTDCISNKTASTIQSGSTYQPRQINQTPQNYAYNDKQEGFYYELKQGG